MDLDLSGFITILFSEKKLIALLISDERILISSTKAFANDDISQGSDASNFIGSDQKVAPYQLAVF